MSDSVTTDEIVQRLSVPIKEAARLATVSEHTIQDWIRLEKVEYFRIPSGRVRIFVDSLMNGQKQPPRRQS